MESLVVARHMVKAICANASFIHMISAASALHCDREHTSYVWGGCMMLRAAEVRANMYGILDKWREGGYSDDMILGDVCLENVRPPRTHPASSDLRLSVPTHGSSAQDRKIYCPFGSIFPCLMNKRMTFKRYASSALHNNSLLSPPHACFARTCTGTLYGAS